ncbi:MAG TPA: FHA domain-containing protein [Solirubrobacteraceae bacterium]|nr:FHA domain-containing protein [Solirubrobacteraceae bacterium]
MLEPVSVLLKFGFLLVLYLFLVWVVRSALKDLRTDGVAVGESPPSDATGMHAASAGLAPSPLAGVEPYLRVERGIGLEAGSAFDIEDGATLGRGDAVDIRLEDPFSSSRHARITVQGNAVVIEDLGSTNGTYLNGERLHGPQPLHPGDRIRIGDSEFCYEV